MPLFELRDGHLRALRRLHPGPDLYEAEIEQLVWDDLEAFLGEPLFPVARQARLPGGGIPDVLALDGTGRVVVIEVKRDIDRGQLAQALEYAGWARQTNLDELAQLYNRGEQGRGAEAFFTAWLTFTATATPVTISPSPRLVLVARDFEERTRAALDFLRENGLPVSLLPVTVYSDDDGRRIVDVDIASEPSLAPTGGTATERTERAARSSRRVTVADLLDAGLLAPDEDVVFTRPRVGETHQAIIRADGSFELSDGLRVTTPSAAATQVASVPAYDGWVAWRVPRLGGTKLADLRTEYLTRTASAVDGSGNDLRDERLRVQHPEDGQPEPEP